MKTTRTFQKITTNCICILISTCTNDLVINAKQVNYFEMFMLSLVIECRNSMFYKKHLLIGKTKTELLKLYNFCTKSYKSLLPISN